MGPSLHRQRGPRLAVKQARPPAEVQAEHARVYLKLADGHWCLPSMMAYDGHVRPTIPQSRGIQHTLMRPPSANRRFMHVAGQGTRGSRASRPACPAASTGMAESGSRSGFHEPRFGSYVRPPGAEHPRLRVATPHRPAPRADHWGADITPLDPTEGGSHACSRSRESQTRIMLRCDGRLPPNVGQHIAGLLMRASAPNRSGPPSHPGTATPNRTRSRASSVVSPYRTDAPPPPHVTPTPFYPGTTKPEPLGRIRASKVVGS